MNALKTLWVWVCRFRNRKGYGVHSPSAFYFIRAVIHEKEAYYAYEELHGRRTGCLVLPEKVDKLLLRLANYIRPENVIQVGEEFPLSREYLQAGCRRAEYFRLKDEGEPTECLQALLGNKPIGLFHITDPLRYKKWVDAALKHISANTLFVIEGIHRNRESVAYWQELRRREEVGITYDLYEVGLVFFNKAKIKQHYKVNFV